MHIRYNLIKLVNALVFQVTEQSELVTTYLQSNGQFKAHNGWRIKVASKPGLDMATQTIYLRGTNFDLDHNPSSLLFFDNTTRNEVYQEITDAFNEFKLDVMFGSLNDDNLITADTSYELITASYVEFPSGVREVVPSATTHYSL